MKVWIVEPHPGNRRCDYYIEKDFRKMQAYLNDHFDDLIDRNEDAIDSDGLRIVIKRVEMSQEEYEEITEGDDR